MAAGQFRTARRAFHMATALWSTMGNLDWRDSMEYLLPKISSTSAERRWCTGVRGIGGQVVVLLQRSATGWDIQPDHHLHTCWREQINHFVFIGPKLFFFYIVVIITWNSIFCDRNNVSTSFWKPVARGRSAPHDAGAGEEWWSNHSRQASEEEHW